MEETPSLAPSLEEPVQKESVQEEPVQAPAALETEQPEVVSVQTEIEETVADKAETALDFIEYLKQLVQAETPDRDKIEALKAAFYKHEHQEIELARRLFVEAGNAIEEFSMDTYNALETEFKSILNLWRDKRAEQLAAQEQERRANLEVKNRIIESIHALNEDTEDIYKSLTEVRRLQAEWKATGAVPQEENTSLWKRYQTELERFYDQLRLYNEFRDYDSKKNLEDQTALCEAAEKLKDDNDVVAAFRRLQTLHEQWRETGPVAKEVREEIWLRFKAASTEINKRYQEFFERLKSLEKENMEQKNALCESLEAISIEGLTAFKAWEKKTAEVMAIQEKWKAIGFAPKKQNAKIFERYRSACDRFFQAKSAFYQSIKEELNANAAKKRELCEKAEALKDSTDWNAATAQFVQWQKEWKEIGAVPRRLSDALWKRFVAACDYFFEQKEKNASSQKNEQKANLEAKKALMAELKALNTEGLDIRETVKAFTERWNAIGHVPFKAKDKLYEEWHDLVGKLLKSGGRPARRDARPSRPLSEKGQLLRQIEELNAEIRTSENNIGFFTLSSKKPSAGGLLDQMRAKIEELKRRRDELVKKAEALEEEA